MLILTCVYYMQVHVHVTVSLKREVERGSTLTFTCNLSYINFLSFTWKRKFYPEAEGWGGGGGGYSTNFLRGGSAPRSKPLPFYIPFITKKLPLSYTFY